MAIRQPFKGVKWVKHKRKKFTKREQNFIFKRDNYTCQLCGKDLSEIPTDRVLDHKVPLKQLGSNHLSNIWLLCYSCDKDKKATVLPLVISERIEQLKKVVCK